MTSSKQTTFDVFRVAADRSIDEHRMTWPSAAHPEKLKPTLSLIGPRTSCLQHRKRAAKLDHPDELDTR